MQSCEYSLLAETEKLLDTVDISARINLEIHKLNIALLFSSLFIIKQFVIFVWKDIHII